MKYSTEIQSYTSQFMVMCTGKCYLMQPVDEGDWYDTTTFMKPDTILQAIFLAESIKYKN